MTIGGWILFIFFAVAIGVFGVGCYAISDDYGSEMGKVWSVLLAVAAVIGLFFGMRWYFTNTASGQRALVDQQAELNSGLERTITIYTADGNQIAQYTGKIDIEDNQGGYLLFDFEGKRYTYYNCFVESIAEIG